MKKKILNHLKIHYKTTTCSLICIGLPGILLFMCCIVLFLAQPAPARGYMGYQGFPRFVVSFPEEVHREPVSARVILFFSRPAGREPRYSSPYTDIQPVYAIDVNNLRPGERVVFSPEKFQDPGALAFPGPFSRLEAGTWYVQVLFDIDKIEPDYNAEGNLYSRVSQYEPTSRGREEVELVADQVIRSRLQLRDTDRVKLVEIRSKLLSDFHGRDVKLRAGVVLPSAYNVKTEQQFPVLYTIPGFGGDHTSAWRMGNSGNREMIQVILDPKVPLGHSVLANSANNGPVGDALVQELIPEIEKRFRAIPHPYGRLVTGHSSGGWASLWLQVAYPDFFGGCWSFVPDPVDFTHFQTMNIYKDLNGHWTDEGYPRPLARSGGEVIATFGDVDRREYVVGYGGQLDSFNAVFSPRGENGEPLPVMDKLTGIIDHKVAEYWKRYDIRLVLENNWATLGPKLKGKLHIVAGGWDTYYLALAVVSLRDFLETTDYDGYVEILPGDHGSFRTQPFEQRINREMTEYFEAGQKAYLEVHSISGTIEP